jgi:Ca2+-binding EF-hand superfamily protein
MSRTAMRRMGIGLPLLLAAFQGLAQNGPPPRLALQALDTDHDGQLSTQEIQAAPTSLLALDRNGDGQLTADEFQPRPQESGASSGELVNRLMAFDKNGDAVLTPDEMPARMQNLFARADSNHDGKLTAEEIRGVAERQAMPQGAPNANGGAATRNDPILNALDLDHDGILSGTELGASSNSLKSLDSNGDGKIAADEMRMREPSPQDRVNHLFDEWDTNKDGKIAQAEAPDRLQQQFSSIDQNGDGFLDKDELLHYFSTQSSGRRSGQQNQPGASGTAKEPNQ